MRYLTRSFLALALLLPVLSAVAQENDSTEQDGIDYLFAWPFIDTSDMAPRGGTTHGLMPETLEQSSAAWNLLQADGLDKIERDRRAIRAMAGAYRVSFDFLETAGFTPGFVPAKPYRSWGTEYIYVIADEPELISLQHILVMVIEDENGELSEPIVTKHWRQDWRFEDTGLHEHVGHGIWERTTLSDAQADGQWTQAVFQVDDSPRYESWGQWRHFPTRSAWQGSETRRPLPRREFSVRDDYDVLLGSNRHTILPTGWIHEQDNLKAVVYEQGRLDAEQPFVAREIGINRYQLIEGFDFSAGDDYWQATAGFWSLVRDAWSRRFEAHDRIHFSPKVDDQSMMMTLFGMASDVAAGAPFERERYCGEVESVFERHVQARPQE